MHYSTFETVSGKCFTKCNLPWSLLRVLTHILLHVFHREGLGGQLESQTLHLCDHDGVVEAMSLQVPGRHLLALHPPEDLIATKKKNKSATMSP